ncbi:RTX iron-regulated FrpC family protein, partial [Neisseria meningitidis]|uniref:RTX iron-regulated FrpC family protein n=1 Tax=Neisseria meningitidis TaxID=487 RepID=UPI0025756C50
AYEDKRHIPENPYFHEFYYIKKGENPAIITHRNYHRYGENDYSTSVGSCINGFTVRYYPFIREKQQLTQQELVGYVIWLIWVTVMRMMLLQLSVRMQT